MARKLLDAVQEMEAQEAKKIEKKDDIEKKEVKRPIEKILSREGAKDKQISAKVNMKMYNAFTTINKLQGLSNNSALNMIITRYVRENKSLLDEDNFI